MTKTNPYKPPKSKFSRDRDSWGEQIHKDNEADWFLFWVIFLFLILFFSYGHLFKYLVGFFRYLVYNEAQ